MIGWFDLTPDGHAGNQSYDASITKGTVRLKVDYEKPLSDAITVVCVCEFSASGFPQMAGSSFKRSTKYHFIDVDFTKYYHFTT